MSGKTALSNGRRRVGEQDLGAMRLLRSIWGMAKLGMLLLQGSAELIVRRPATRQGRALWLHRLCRRAMVAYRIEVRVRGTFPENGVVILNHLSYLDIVLLASVQPCVFVSKAEIESWPLLGWMTTMAGTVYVTRGRGGSAREAGGEMRSAAESGLPVVLFPEGTTSSGETVLKFHSGLLAEAVTAGLPVTAAYLRYGVPEGLADVRNDVAYWGDRPMLPHVFRFLALRGVRAELTIANAPIRFEAAAKASRKLIGVEARRAVCELGGASEDVPMKTREAVTLGGR